MENLLAGVGLKIALKFVPFLYFLTKIPRYPLYKVRVSEFYSLVPFLNAIASNPAKCEEYFQFIPSTFIIGRISMRQSPSANLGSSFIISLASFKSRASIP